MRCHSFLNVVETFDQASQCIGYGRRGEYLSFHPFRDRVFRRDPLAGIMFVARQSGLFTRRTLGQKETCVEAARRKRRRHPPADIHQGCGIDPGADFFKDFPRRAYFCVFVWIELSAGKRVIAALKCHMLGPAYPEDVQFATEVPEQDDCCCGAWTRHTTQYILQEIMEVRCLNGSCRFFFYFLLHGR